MKVSCGDVSYDWLDNWAEPPPDSFGGLGWAHHDVVVTGDRKVVAFQSGGDAVVVFDERGHVLDSWSTGLVEGHGMTVTGAGIDAQLWIADPGTKMVRDERGLYEERSPDAHGRVVAFDLTGRRTGALARPDIDAYRAGRYSPTAIAVDDGPGGDGSVWIADGYGGSLVHRFSRTGELLLTLTGEEGEGRFDCPHSLLIDRRASSPRLYITDRQNNRLQIYNLDGTFVRSVSDGLRLPSALATFGEQLIVAELTARVAVLDDADRVVCYLGANDAAPARAGWPNALDDEGRPLRPDDLEPGGFNSPHGLAVNSRGDIYVAEWLIGGRLTRLRRT